MKDDKVKTFKKITTGFVIQNYELDENDTANCVSQSFIAGECEYETEDLFGNNVVLDEQQEQYFPYDMIQPD